MSAFPNVRVLATVTALVLAASSTGCGGDRAASDAEPGDAPADTAVEAPAADTLDADEAADASLLQEIPNGSPMPDASRTGIPPYPGAIVYARYPRSAPGIQSMEAFTPDSWAVVEAHYDTVLGPRWTKTDAEDTTVYEKGEDEAAITLSPWNPEDLPGDEADHPDVLRNARTAIGAAWRTSSP